MSLDDHKSLYLVTAETIAIQITNILGEETRVSRATDATQDLMVDFQVADKQFSLRLTWTDSDKCYRFHSLLVHNGPPDEVDEIFRNFLLFSNDFNVSRLTLLLIKLEGALEVPSRIYSPIPDQVDDGEIEDPSTHLPSSPPHSQDVLLTTASSGNAPPYRADAWPRRKAIVLTPQKESPRVIRKSRRAMVAAIGLGLGTVMTGVMFQQKSEMASEHMVRDQTIPITPIMPHSDLVPPPIEPVPPHREVCPRYQVSLLPSEDLRAGLIRLQAAHRAELNSKVFSLQRILALSRSARDIAERESQTATDRRYQLRLAAGSHPFRPQTADLIYIDTCSSGIELWYSRHSTLLFRVRAPQR